MKDETLEADVAKLRELFDKYCTKDFYPKAGGFTTIGEEGGLNISFLNFHGSFEITVNRKNYTNHWRGCRTFNMREIFEERLQDMIKFFTTPVKAMKDSNL